MTVSALWRRPRQAIRCQRWISSLPPKIMPSPVRSPAALRKMLQQVEDSRFKQRDPSEIVKQNGVPIVDVPCPNTENPTVMQPAGEKKPDQHRTHVALVPKPSLEIVNPGPPEAVPSIHVTNTVIDLMFEMFKEGQPPADKVPMKKFLDALRETGLRKTDPRLKEMKSSMRALDEFKSGTVSSVDSLNLERSRFKDVVAENIVLISRAFRGQFIIPDFTGFCKHIEELYGKCKSINEGKVASYIPQLARYSPDNWGVAVCTIDGQRFSIGDVTNTFTIQSCSKPITYGVALSELGSEIVHKYIGQEPSGRMFNELVLDYGRKPHNPMINAGAIVCCAIALALIKPGMNMAEKFDYITSYYKRMAANEHVSFSNATFLSERETGDRNYAIGYYMKEYKCLPEKTSLQDILDFYFQMCALEINAESGSVMAATIANGGICPMTEEKCLESAAVRDMLSLMHSCGMYDYSGEFAFKIGLPAKSGVSGAMLLVVPNVMGMCLWSPPLDSLGNSVRGVQFCKELVNLFNFHQYDNLRHCAQKKDPRRSGFYTKAMQALNLPFSAATGDITALRRHLLSGMDMGQCDYDGRTALHLAAAEGHKECVQFLLQFCKVKPDVQDRWGHTPLTEARIFNHTVIADLLEEYMKSYNPNIDPVKPEEVIADSKP